MGSFFSTCSISHVTLKQEKTSIQLLSPTYDKDFSDHKHMIVTNDGCMAFFAPFAFPIHGEYYDYGYLENIQRDNNVIMLEEFFNLDIEDIIKCIGKKDRIPEIGRNGKEITNVEILPKLAMTYIRTEVLEYLENGWESLMNESTQGFSKQEKAQNYLKVLTGNSVKLTKTAGSLYLELEKTTSDTNKAKIIEQILELNEQRHECKFNTYLVSHTKFNMFSMLPITIEFKEQFLKQYQFINKLGSRGLNRLLIPSMYGTQETNWAATLELNELVNGLIEKDSMEELEDIVFDHIDYDTKELSQDFYNDYSFSKEKIKKALENVIRNNF